MPFSRPCCVQHLELSRAELHGVVSFTVIAGKHNNVAAHGARIHDGKVTKAAQPDNADAVGRLCLGGHEAFKDGDARADQGPRMLGRQAVGDGVDVVLVADGVVAKCAVVYGGAVLLADGLGAVVAVAGDALGAGPAGLFLSVQPCRGGLLGRGS